MADLMESRTLNSGLVSLRYTPLLDLRLSRNVLPDTCTFPLVDRTLCFLRLTPSVSFIRFLSQ